MILNASSAFQENYYEGFLYRVHQLIAWAYQDIQSLCLGSDTDEEVITAELVKAIDQRFNDPAIPYDYFYYSVHEEKPVHSSSRPGKQRQRLDMIVTCSAVQPRLCFSFEAKRLKSSSHAIGKYLGKEGLMCFINCEYAQNESVAGMLAYLQDKSATYWKVQLEKALRKPQKSAETKLQGDLKSSQLHADLPHEWESLHQRTHGHPIRIFHLFLEFNAA